MNADDALQLLVEGNERYVLDKENVDTSSDIRAGLVSGQSPHAIILSCADSRVIPESIFDASGGQIFVCRVAGNIANVSTVASIEYAVAHLGTKLIMVLGHESCGAVTAAIAGVKESPSLAHLLEQIEPAVNECASSEVNDVVRCNAELTAKELISKSEIIRDAQGVKIVSGFYNLSSGKVDLL
ncbi:MAG: carbonic anhydrase [Flavobacteriales bacterium]|nr:carbonic anhydrase [Flavobacteriales bacterium]